MSDEERLKRLIEKRNKTLDSVEKFDSHFVLFSRKELRDAVDRVEKSLGEDESGISILYDDPQRYTNEQYLVYVIFNNHKPKDKQPRGDNMTSFAQVYSNRIHGRSNNPTIKFEGFSYNGEVQVSFNEYGFNTDDFTKNDTIPARELDSDRCFKIIVDFLESLYS